MRRLFLILICLLFITPSQAEEKLTPTEGIEQQLRIQDERLNHIEKQASLERQQIEVWYKCRLNELRQLAEKRARQLTLDNKALWTEFVKMNRQTPLFDTYFKKSTTIFTRDVKSSELHSALMDSYFLSATADLLLDKDFHELLAELVNGSAYNPHSLLIRDSARKLLPTVRELDSKLTALQHRRAVKMAAIAQGEQSRKADVRRVMCEIKAVPESGNKGVVSAIIYNQKAALCMIGGFDEVLKEGDSIGTILIVKIAPDHVEFSKASQTWTQQVGKPDGDAWK